MRQILAYNSEPNKRKLFLFFCDPLCLAVPTLMTWETSPPFCASMHTFCHCPRPSLIWDVLYWFEEQWIDTLFAQRHRNLDRAAFIIWLEDGDSLRKYLFRNDHLLTGHKWIDHLTTNVESNILRNISVNFVYKQYYSLKYYIAPPTSHHALFTQTCRLHLIKTYIRIPHWCTWFQFYFCQLGSPVEHFRQQRWTRTWSKLSYLLYFIDLFRNPINSVNVVRPFCFILSRFPNSLLRLYYLL